MKCLQRAVSALALAGAMAGASHFAEAASPPMQVWQGSYDCAQGVTGLTLALSVDPTRQVRALFEFYGITQNPRVPKGCFEMSGSFDASGHLTLAPGAWRVQPPNFVSVGLYGAQSGSEMTGTIFGPGCSHFALTLLPPSVANRLPAACLGVAS